MSDYIPENWPWTINPRSVNECFAIKAGADPLEVAAKSDETFLGWELNGPDDVGRGHFTGPDLAFIMRACIAYVAALEAK